MSRPDLPCGAGDIVCTDCNQVLWCRAHDPWRAWKHDPPADHWGRMRPGTPHATLLDALQHVLQLTADCPAGPSGDEIRRVACELIEADSGRQRDTRRRRMLKVVARLQRHRPDDTPRHDHPSALTLERLTEALRREFRPG